ncbi:MAG: response regulator [Myxococcales bacterium]|nr:response regulator [Myxococcales bacterium]MDD9968001.1 response regulator [Myxococcales bacterium]
MDITGRKILVVEDEVIVAMDVSTRLERMGFVVEGPVDRGEAALEVCKKTLVDGVLMDIRLRGELDGIDTARLLRKERQVPIVFLSAYSDANTLSRIVEIEPDGYLLKPFDERAMWVALNTALRRHDHEQARSRAENERHLIDARFRAILDHSHDGIISVDGQQRIIIFNHGAEQIFGYRASELMGASLDVLIPADSRTRHKRIANSVLEGGVVSRPMTLREVEGVRRDGEAFPIDVSLSTLKFDGEVIATAIVRDLTERKRLESRSQHAQKLETIGRLASSVAHDFNNQLVPIAGYAQLLCRGLAETDSRMREDAEEIRNAAARAARLTRQLLLFGRREITQPVALPVDDFLQELARVLARLVGPDIAVDMKLCAQGACIYLDPCCLEQVVINLAVNARDALQSGGRMNFRTAQVDASDIPQRLVQGEQERFVLLEVSDDGAGIPEELHARIFEPFYTTKPAGAGTGLGLSSVLSIVNDARGTVDLDSEVGQGTTFRLYFPVHSASGEARAHDDIAHPLRLSGSHRSSVLIVENDDDVRRFASRVLSEAGYHVVAARTPRQALSLCPSPLHVLVTDLVLPGMSGLELAHRLATEHDCAIVLMTGYGDEELGRRGMVPKGHMLLRKPFAAEGLEAAVLTQQHMRDQREPSSRRSSPTRSG